MMRRLTKLANKYCTDKGDNYWYAHGFSDFYEHFFEKYTNPTILEIGTAEGSSAKMLNDFFDGECTIYTLDINESCGKNVEGYENIKFFHVDCSDENAINKFLNEDAAGVEFDIIIEDGSHMWDHQFISLYFFSKRVKKGGIYILEDLHTSYAGTPEKNYENSPLFFLNFFEGGIGLYENEKEDLSNRINETLIYNRYNANNPNFYKNRSVTSIITFK